MRARCGDCAMATTPNTIKSNGLVTDQIQQANMALEPAQIFQLEAWSVIEWRRIRSQTKATMEGEVEQ